MQFQCEQCKSILNSRAVTDGMRVTCPVCNAETVCHPYGAGSRPRGVSAEDDGADTNENPTGAIHAKIVSAIRKLKGFNLFYLFSKVLSKHSRTDNGEVVLSPKASQIKRGERSIGYANRRPRHANGNYHSRTLKPAKKSHRGLWVGGLLLLVVGMVALCLVYACVLKKGHSSKAPIVVNTEIVNGIKWTYRVKHGVFFGKAEIGNGSSAAIKASTTGAITVPSRLGGYPVTSIGPKAFLECDGLTSVMIPDSVTSIGSGAFYCCRGLKSVTIPDSVTSIGSSAFHACSGLKSISVAAGNNNYKSANGLLLSKDGKTLIQGVNGDVTIPNCVTHIGDSAFTYCRGLTSVTIPDSVTCIGSNAFWGCSGLTSVTIPDSVTSIESSVFLHCNGLKSISVAAGNNNYKSVKGLLLSKDGKTLIQGVNGDVTIPNCVTRIGDKAFVMCKGLTSVTMPDSVTSIGECAFMGCRGLTNVTIGNGVTSIGSGAFEMSKVLTSVTIPNSVTSIGEYAFWGCSGLTSVTISDSVTSIGRSAFKCCSGLTSVTIPESVTSIGRSAFLGCRSLERVRLPRRLEGEFDKSVFDECSEDMVITYYGWREK